MSGQEIKCSKVQSHTTKNDGKMHQFCEEHLLQVSPLMSQSRSPTFYHFNGKDTSCIDLFIKMKSKEIITSISIHSRQPLNTSPHHPVSATIHFTIHSNKACSKAAKKQPAHRVRWDKIDSVVYMEETDLKLIALLNNIQAMPTSRVTDRINTILSSSALSTCPLPPKRKKATKYRWYYAFRPMV